MLPGCYEEDSSKGHHRTLLFTIEDKTGALDTCLHVFRDAGLNLRHIESRPSKTSKFDYDFTVELHIPSLPAISKLIVDLENAGAKSVHLVGGKQQQVDAPVDDAVPWFPRKLSDLDSFAEKTLEYGSDLSADHPGFTDATYRKRRAEITEIAKKYRTIEYTPQELDTWRTVYTGLKKLHPTHACREHQYVFPLLEQNCGYGPDNIPQLEDVSRFLKECTGFTLRPVMGLLSSRDFLNGLAFRVFHSTQYVRHHSKPHYTPEPDVCHELLGHVPLFANAAFAAFSQEIGLASLGATDEDIVRLATIYWFTVEFGLCRDEVDKTVKAYGAGLLSSFGELEYSLSGKPQIVDFTPELTCRQDYPITQYQPLYYVASSFAHAQNQVRAFAQTLSRPFTLKYDAYTCTVQVLDTRMRIVKYVEEVKAHLDAISDAVQKL